MKKIYSVIFILLAFLLSVGCLNGFYSAFADEQIAFSTESESAYLMDYKTKTVIYSKNELEHMPIASMCKIMTLLLTFEAMDNNEISLTDTIVVSKNASSMGGSQVFLEENGEYLVGELVKSIVVASANDACVAIAEKLCGTQAEFVNQMNEKAKDLQMNDTIFVNCTGLPQPGQYSCAKDVSTMFNELLKHQEYYKFSRIWTDVVCHPKDRKTEISNTNKLIRFYNGCDSGKTGYTSEAGHCLVASAVKNDMRLVSVVIKAPNSKARFRDVSNMFNFGFENYVNKKILSNDTELKIKVNVKGGKKDTLSVIPEKSLFVFCKKNQKRNVELNFEPSKTVCAPVKTGDIVGQICAYENGVEIDRVNILANETILEKTYFDVLRDIAKQWSVA